MFNQALFDLLTGVVLSDAAVSAINPTWASYITKRNIALDSQWAYYLDGQYINGVFLPHHHDAQDQVENGTEWVNFYDRVYMYYHIFKGSGYTNTTARDRARAICEYYMSDITLGFTNWLIQPLYDLPVGVALYYADTGSSIALNWLAVTSANWRSARWLASIGSTVQTPNGFDGRTTSRGLNSLITAHLAGAPKVDHPDVGGPSNPNITQPEAIRQCLNQILAGRDSDGMWRYSSYFIPAYPNDTYPAPFTNWGGSGKVAKPWMVGMVMDSLIYYDTCFEPDTRIAPAIQATCEYMFSGPGTTPSQHTGTTLSGRTGVPNTHLFDAGEKNFYYIEGASPDEQLPDSWYTPAGGWPSSVISVSLNGMLLNSYAYTYAKTGNSLWSTRAQAILEGIDRMLQPQLSTPSFTSAKTLNENFVWTYKTPALLVGGIPVNPVDPHKIRGKWRDN